MKNTHEVTNLEELKKLLQTLNKKAILKFTSNNCPPCKALDKTINNFTTDRDYDIINIRTDTCMIVPRSYGITATPTILVVNRKGEEKSRKMGYMKPETWSKFLEDDFFSYEESEDTLSNNNHDENPRVEEKGAFTNAMKENEKRLPIDEEIDHSKRHMSNEKEHEQKNEEDK